MYNIYTHTNVIDNNYHKTIYKRTTACAYSYTVCSDSDPLYMLTVVSCVIVAFLMCPLLHNYIVNVHLYHGSFNASLITYKSHVLHL